MAKFLGSRFGSMALGVLVGACGAPDAADSAAPGALRDGLFGDLSTNSCTLEQRTTLASAHLAGMKIAMTEAFDACLRRRVMEFYMPCYQGSDDPYASSTRSVQYTQALAIMRQGNTAGVTVTCANLGGAQGSAQVGSYGDGHEDMNMDNGFINAQSLQGIDDWELADVAGTIWHEAMHQQGYRHDDCGYPEGEYSRGFNSIPYMADRCMRSAGILGRLIASANDGRRQSLGIGRHRASAGDFGSMSGTDIARLTLGPGLRARVCTGEAANGAGTGCTTYDNALPEYGSSIALGGGAIAVIEVEPLVLLFSQTDYRGNVQALSFGEHRANTGGFSIVGNDQTRSIYVPPGAKVRVCTDEGGTTGHGYWSCQFYDRSIPTNVLAGGISYAEVQPVVTGFAEANLYGAFASYGAGRWSRPLGDNNMASLVVPQSLTGRVCTDWSATGAGTCRSHTRTAFDLGSGVANAVSFLEVTPALLGTFPLTVNRAFGSGPGTVESTPYNLVCTGACSGNFAARTEVFLRGTSSGYEPAWTGCDRVSGTTCVVSMMSAQTVTVKFNPLPDTCYPDCLDSCLAEGQLLPRQCVQMCRAECEI